MHPILDDLTVVVGIDRNTFPLFCVSVETWKRFRPQLFHCPWVVFYDARTAPPREELRNYFTTKHGVTPSLVASRDRDCYDTQREFMLTGWVYVPAKEVKTRWFLKIDCDVLALDERPDWCLPQWTEDNPVLVASPWSYTKAKGGGGSISDWANKLELWGDMVLPNTPRLNLSDRIRGDKIKYPRMCSWVSYYQAAWYRTFARACQQWAGGRLPVPSQDTLAWYYAERSGANYLKAKQKRRGWTNVPSFERLKQKAMEVLLCQKV